MTAAVTVAVDVRESGWILQQQRKRSRSGMER